MPAGVTSLVLVVALVLSGAVPGFTEALAGFSDPVAYFLIGVLTIGLAVSRSGLAERVCLHGRVDREQCLVAMRSSDALLFTSSDFDTQGLVLLEATAMSLPTIYCDPALSETVPEGGGLLSADPSPASLAAAIGVLVNDRDKLRKMTEAVTSQRDTARQSLHTEKIISIYDSLVDRVSAQIGSAG